MTVKVETEVVTTIGSSPCYLCNGIQPWIEVGFIYIHDGKTYFTDSETDTPFRGYIGHLNNGETRIPLVMDTSAWEWQWVPAAWLESEGIIKRTY